MEFDSDTLREKFLEFFEKNNHKVMPSDSLVPAADPTVLFTSAGMNQFKSQFLGIDIKDSRVATCQKCLRTDDLDKVGKTVCHHTFFEMLGNFSFGDYFKKEAISLAWEFLTKVLSISADRLWVSVYKDDDESFAIWHDIIGIDKVRIVRLGDKENFWPSEAKLKGPNGPCGPCSEIFFDSGSHVGCQKEDCSPRCSCGRFVEVWNLVFTQFERKPDAALVPLPQKNIDTGMGLERLCALMQGVKNNFETDLFTPIISEIKKLSVGKSGIDEQAKEMRFNAIADHLRAVCFAISDGVYPSNEDRGYVIRNLIRRSFLYGKDLGVEGAFLYKLVGVLSKIMDRAYPELTQQRENIAQIIQSEESRFISTLETRVPEFIEAVRELSQKGVSQVPADMAFKFYDTYGLPWDLMQAEASKFNVFCDKEEFSRLLDKQRKRSRDKSKLSSSIFVKLYDFKHDDVKFIDVRSLSAKVIAIFKEDLNKKKSLVIKASSPMQVEIVLDNTPFYAESGGQIGDAGFLENEKTKVEITDTKKIEGTIIHFGKILEGDININDTVCATIDDKRRLAIARNHTATHLLQAALRKVLGPHVRQQGSLVTDEYLRFDFSHPAALRQEEIRKVEDIVNKFINSNDKLTKEFTSLGSAKKSGALAFFGEKYSDTVRMVSIGDYSRELCGGSHLEATGQIGFFKIMKESSVASGIRRIQAATAEFAREFEKEKKEKRDQELGKKEQELKEKELRNQLICDKENRFKEESESILGRTQMVGPGLRCISILKDDCDEGLLRTFSDILKAKQDNLIIILGSVWQDRGIFIISLTNDLADKGIFAASKNAKIKSILDILVSGLSQAYGIQKLRGGGREVLAQGSCLKEDIQKVISAAPDILKKGLKDFKP